LGRARVGGVVRVALGALRSADSNAAAADLHALATPLLEITGRPATGYLDLTRAKIGVLQDEPDGWGAGELVLNGLEYEDLHRSGVPVDVRIEWLKSGTSRLRGPAEEQRTASYVPQPYEQLAATYRRTGNDQDARTVLLHKWRARNRAIPWRQWYRKLWNYTQDLAIGYGYAPWRALSVMLIVLVLAIVLFRLNGTVPNEESSLFETIVFAFVLAVPGFGLRSGFWPDSANLSDQITMLALSFFGLTLGAAIISAVIRTMRRE
jgi:hypothetical protein